MAARRIGLAALALLATLQCSEKKSGFFQPVGLDLVNDTTPPTFTGHQPPNTVDVFSGRGGAMVTVLDEQSGIDASSVVATLPSGTALPVTVQAMSATQAMITIDLNGLAPETTAKIGVRAKDNAGNEGQTSFDFFHDPFAPRIDAGFPVAETNSNADETTFRIPTMVEDPSFARTIGRILDAGADGACGGGDDAAIEEVQTDQAEFEFVFTVPNPVAPGGDALTASYCFQIEASDRAQGKTGEPDPNTATATSATSVRWSRGLDLSVAFLGIPCDGAQGNIPPGRYQVEVREGFDGPAVGTVEENLAQAPANSLLFCNPGNPDHLAMTNAMRVVDLDTFAEANGGGGSLAPAQAASPLVGFSQYGWCSELDLLQFTPAVVRMRDASGALVHQQNLTSLPDNPAGTADPICGFVNVPDPDRVVQVELDVSGTHVRLIGACQRNAAPNDLEGRCAAP